MEVGERIQIRDYDYTINGMKFVLENGDTVEVDSNNVFGTTALNRDTAASFKLARKTFTHYCVES